MFSIENWSKERVHDVMLELLYSFNYMWFIAEQWIDKNCPEAAAREGRRYMAEEFGSYEAKRLAKTVDGNLEGVDRLIRFLEHSHWCAFENIDIARLSDSSIRMTTLNCSSQKAARKWGLEYYDCGEIALCLRQAFFRQIDSSAEVTCLFAPPGERPEGCPPDASCIWTITIR